MAILARISPQPSATAADTGMSTALRSVGLLSVVSTTPPGPSRRAPCIHARLHPLATNPGEICGLGSIPVVYVMRRFPRLQGFPAPLAGADADHLLEVVDEDLPVADLPRVRGG